MVTWMFFDKLLMDNRHLYPAYMDIKLIVNKSCQFI